MDVAKFLQQCGDFHRYQFLMLALFAVINVLSAIHYFSQTIISFVPDHWCSSPAVDNFTVEELRRWNGELGGELQCRSFEELHGINGSFCSQWIYDSDNGFKSLTSEVIIIIGMKEYTGKIGLSKVSGLGTREFRIFRIYPPKSYLSIKHQL